MKQELVLYEADAKVGFVTLNRPEKLNALGNDLRRELAAALAKADEDLFGEPETRHSQAGPAFVMPWIIGFKKARELLYLGEMIDAKTALDLGMVNRVVARADLEAQTLKFAKRLALIAPEALASTK